MAFHTEGFSAGTGHAQFTGGKHRPVFNDDGIVLFKEDREASAQLTYFQRNVSQMSGALPRERQLNEEQIIQLKLFCNGVAVFFEEWVKGKYHLKPQEAARILYQVLPEDFKENLWETESSDQYHGNV